MAKFAINVSGAGNSDYYGTFISFNNAFSGNVIRGLEVTQNSSPDMTVRVKAGNGIVREGSWPGEIGWHVGVDTADPGDSVTIATSDPSNARIDYVLAWIDKTAAASPTGTNNTNVFKVTSVAGTPSGSPAVPTTGQIQTAIGASNPYFILAQIAVGAAATQITTANITDLRSFMKPRVALANGMASNVDSGCVWSQVSGLNGAMTAGEVYFNIAGIMVPTTIAAIASKTFTASKDTYVSFNHLGAVTYTEVTNGAAIPAVPANSVWTYRVVTNGSAITRCDDIRPTVTPHYHALYYSTGGTSGGFVVGSTESNPNFDTTDANGHGAIATTGASSNIRVSRAGLYEITAYMSMSDGTTTSTFIFWIDISTDNGSTYARRRFYDRQMAANNAGGQHYELTTYLPANAIVRPTAYNGAGNIRLAAFSSDANNRYYAGPRLTVTEIR